MSPGTGGRALVVAFFPSTVSISAIMALTTPAVVTDRTDLDDQMCHRLDHQQQQYVSNDQGRTQ